MMRNWRVFSVFLVVTVFAVVLVGAPVIVAEEEGGKSGEDKAQKSRGTGEDENIKSAAGENDPNAAFEAPPQKGGKKTRGGYCEIVVDNWTPWYIDIYVDGDHSGRVSPWGKASGPFRRGSRILYAKAFFTDGTWYSWGPRRVDCSVQYTWKLTE